MHDSKSLYMHLCSDASSNVTCSQRSQPTLYLVIDHTPSVRHRGVVLSSESVVASARRCKGVADHSGVPLVVDQQLFLDVKGSRAGGGGGAPPRGGPAPKGGGGAHPAMVCVWEEGGKGVMWAWCMCGRLG